MNLMHTRSWLRRNFWKATRMSLLPAGSIDLIGITAVAIGFGNDTKFISAETKFVPHRRVQ